MTIACIAAWLAASGMGMMVLINYSKTSAAAINAPQRWPADSELSPTAGLPVLLMFVHPHCPCSRASMGELAIIMRHCQDRVSAHVLFVRSPEMPQAWERTDLWGSAENIPQVEVHSDVDGVESRRFGATTSGSVLLYDKNRELVFAGGITAARGHSGDNAGRAAVISLLTGKSSSVSGTDIFGCELFNPHQVEAPCCRHK